MGKNNLQNLEPTDYLHYAFETNTVSLLKTKANDEKKILDRLVKNKGNLTSKRKESLAIIQLWRDLLNHRIPEEKREN